MLKPSKIAMLTLATLMAGAPLVTTAYAATDSGKEIVVAKTINISGHAKAVISDVRNARFALFDGQTDAALELVKKSREVLDQAILGYALKVDAAGDYVIPLDRSITLAEGFKPTQELELVINKAGAMAQQGQVDEAVVLMKESGVDLDIHYVLLPVLKTISNLENATKNIKAGQFYEANMNLKAIEVSIAIEDLNVEDVPKQGYALKDIK
ncbi:YfdX family protein [Vibrio sp. 99-8-1]|uniref:YfdX family protein n=1 Tax=Vibrio sp. 99-8-1 TaxID=2607602 RepID=UPI0014936D9E|nr:YfdX family protein [Vibrio sp. 99-8-1]NOI67342.1 YfdX family protein [Vibrio sp. 99-8-1]